MDFALCPAGARVACLWLGLLGAALGGLPALLHTAAGAVFWFLWGLFCLCFLKIWAPSLRLRCRGDCLLWESGRLFTFSARLPLNAVAGVSVVESPLMRKAGCCLLVLHAGSGLFFLLPGLARQDARALTALLGEG